jgi:hypothetical protein
MKLFKTYIQCIAQLFMALTLVISTISYAGPGHSHGDEKFDQKHTQALPRFYAESDLYEAVGIINGKEITLYLDRYSSNELVKGAKIEIDLDGSKISSEPHGDGEYLFRLINKIKDQSIPITITINDDGTTDMLAATIDFGSIEPPSSMTWKIGIKIFLYSCFLIVTAYFFYRKKGMLMTHTKKLINQIKERA